MSDVVETLTNVPKDVSSWTLGETIPRLFNETLEPDAVIKFNDRMRDVYGEGGSVVSDYAVAGLKKLGDEFTAQIPYGREMMDRGLHIKGFLEEKFDPKLNNLGSEEEAGYAFRVMPEFELLFDDHDCVNSIVLVFYMVFVGDASKIPDEKVWREIIKRSFFAFDAQRLDSQIYVWNETLKDNPDVRRRAFDVYSLLCDEKVEFLTPEEKKRTIERYRLDTSSYEAFVASDVYDYERWRDGKNDGNDDVLSTRFSETFFFSSDLSDLGHPILNPNGVIGVPDRLRVDHRVGHPELLKWKEFGKKHYMSRVFRECGIMLKKTVAEGMDDPLGFLEKSLSVEAINGSFERSDPTSGPVISSYNESNDHKHVLEHLSKEPKKTKKSLDAGRMSGMKQRGISDFFTKKSKDVAVEQTDGDDEEEDDRVVLDRIRRDFLKEYADVMVSEFESPRDKRRLHPWMVPLERLSNISNYSGNKTLVSHDYLCDAFGSDINKVVASRNKSDNPRDISLSTLSKNVFVYRCLVNTNIWPFHYRSYEKIESKFPVPESQISREIARRGYCRPYEECRLFHKSKLADAVNGVDKRMVTVRKESSVYSPEMDKLLLERENITLFSMLNVEKYQKFGMTLRPPEFFEQFLNVTKKQFDERVTDLVKRERVKNDGMRRTILNDANRRSFTNVTADDDDEDELNIIVPKKPAPVDKKPPTAKRKRQSTAKNTGKTNFKRFKK